MNNRRNLIIALGASALAAPLRLRAQQLTAPAARIGWIVAGSPVTHAVSLAAFRDGLQKLGYSEGQNVTFEYRWADGDLERLPGLVRDLVQQKVDVILAGGTSVAVAAQNATRSIPIVMAGVSDPVDVGLVGNLAHPGGNITGIVANLPDVAVKRLEILKEIIPRMTRVAVIWNPSSSNAQRESKGIKESASGLRLALHFYEAQTLQQLQNALRVIPKSSPDGIIVLNDPFVFTYRKNIAEFASQAKIPSIYGFSEYVTVGGLISYGTNIADTYRRAAAQVDKILKGAKPGDLPVELPRTLELMINKKTANALGVLIPNSILLRADKVIE